MPRVLTDRETLELFMCRVMEMRKRETTYERSKGVVEKRYMVKAQHHVDNIINHLRKRGFDPTKFDQQQYQQKMF